MSQTSTCVCDKCGATATSTNGNSPAGWVKVRVIGAPWDLCATCWAALQTWIAGH